MVVWTDARVDMQADRLLGLADRTVLTISKDRARLRNAMELIMDLNGIDI
jgi:hypothetical protein